MKRRTGVCQAMLCCGCAVSELCYGCELCCGYGGAVLCCAMSELCYGMCAVLSVLCYGCVLCYGYGGAMLCYAMSELCYGCVLCCVPCSLELWGPWLPPPPCPTVSAPETSLHSLFLEGMTHITHCLRITPKALVCALQVQVQVTKSKCFVSFFFLFFSLFLMK